MPCDSCGQDDATHLFTALDYLTGERFPVVRCNRCGLAYTNPRPTQEAMPRYYPPEYHTAHSDPVRRTVETLIRQVRYRRNQQVLQWLQAKQSFAPDRAGRVLDIGCGRGWQLHDLRMHGVDAVGTELSEEAAGFARYELGLDVRVGLLEELGLDGESFDLIMAWHSLEHLPSPRRTLTEAHRLLRPGGYLLVAVPNFGSLQARIFGRRWFHLNVPRHMYHFCASSIGPLMEDAGFQVVRTGGATFSMELWGWAQSFLNLSGLAPNFLYSFIRYRARTVIRRGLPDLIFNLAAGLVLLPGAVGVGLAGAAAAVWLGRAATLQVVAIRARV